MPKIIFKLIPASPYSLAPKAVGGGGEAIRYLICFQNEMGASFLGQCFVFDNIMLGLQPDNSTQSNDCKLLESKHLILMTWFNFFFF